jgi:putative serine protease PepD
MTDTPGWDDPSSPSGRSFSPPDTEGLSGGPSSVPSPDDHRGGRLGGRRTTTLGVTVALALLAGGLGIVVGLSVASKPGSDSVNGARGTTAPTGAATPAPTGAAGLPTGVTSNAPLDVKAILAKVEPSVVDIVARDRGGTGEGSGVIISADGYVLTNAHVVADARTITVTTWDSSQALPATLIGADQARDVALLRIDQTVDRNSKNSVRGGAGFTPAELGRSADVKVGEDVIAIGNALGLRGDPTVTRGIVSAVNRTFDDLIGLIQTDAAINPGSSGGPLVNASGQVIGINTAGEDADNIGYAIPIDLTKTIADRLKSGLGPAPVAFLGVSTREPSDGEAGATIVDLVTGGPAAQAGLSVGDRIVTFDGQPVAGAEALSGLIQARQPGDTVQVVIERAASSRTLQVRLGTRPTQ